MSKQRKVTWEEVDKCCKNILEQIHDEEYFVTIVSVARGGLVPGTMLSYALEIKDVVSCNIKAYSKNKILNQPTFVHSFSPRLVNDRKILIVDDLVDSGKSLQMLKGFLDNETTAKYKIATLFYKPKSIVVPDFYGKKVSDSTWLVFPWEE